MVLGLSEPYVFEVDVAPEALIGRLRAAINVRPKRMFGVLKVTDEWVGVVHGDAFEVWERRQHATRAHGRIRGRRGGTRVEAEITITRRSLVLIGLFLALFAFGAAGSVLGPGAAQVAGTTIAAAILAGLAMTALFWWTAARQRAALRRFLNGVFSPPA